MKPKTKSTLQGIYPGVRWTAVLLLTIVIAPTDAAAQGLCRIPLLTSTAFGQTLKNNPGRNSSRANKLLRDARQRMQRGEFDEAESLIRRAEPLFVPPSPYFEAAADTPEKLLKELEQLRNEKLVTPRRSRKGWLSTLFNRRKPGEADVPDDPFRIKNDPFSSGPDNQTKVRAADFLDKGRLSLSQGNISGAVASYQKAVALNAKFAPNEYSPKHLLNELQAKGVRDLDIPSGQLGAPASVGPSATSFVNTDPGNNARPDLPNERSRPNSNPSTFANPFANPFAETNSASTDPSAQSSGAWDPGLLNFTTGHDSSEIRIVPSNLNVPTTTGSGEQSGYVRNDGPPRGTSSDRSKRIINNSGESPLREARLALAKGDLDRAEAMVQRAKDDGIVNPIQDDTPDRVMSLILRSRQLRAANSSSTVASGNNSERARFLMEQSEGLLRYGDYAAASELTQQANRIGAAVAPPEISNLPPVMRTGIPLGGGESAESRNGATQRSLDIAPLPKTSSATTRDFSFDASSLFADSEDMNERPVAGMIASTIGEVSDEAESKYVSRAIYNPYVDDTENQFAGAIEPDTQKPPTRSSAVTRPVADHLIRQGDQALAKNDFAEARAYFLRAMQDDAELSPSQRQQLQDRMQKIGADAKKPRKLTETADDSKLEKVQNKQTVLYRKIAAEIMYVKRQTDRQRAHDPIASLEKLKDLQKRIRKSELTQTSRRELARRVSRSIVELEKHIEDNAGDIKLDQQNQEVVEKINRERQLDAEMQTKLSQLVEEFEKHMDQQRYPEAELLARQARQIDPDNPLTEVMVWKSTFIKRYMRNMNLRDRSEQGVVAALLDTEESAIPFDTSNPYQLPDSREWKELRRRRDRYSEQKHTHLNQAEQDIQRQLNTPVEVRFDNRPLAEVVNTLSNLTSVNMFVDPEGLMAEGVTSNEPVNLNLTGKPISLRSALALILQPLHLSYVIQNEVLKITSEQMRDSDVYHHVYSVADLVAPIPNFNPSLATGLPGAIAAAHEAVGWGAGNSSGQSFRAPMGLAQQQQSLPGNSSALAQRMNNGLMPGRSFGGGPRQTVNAGPDGFGGAAQADFDPLIELITTTISPTSWDEVGGPGAIHEFEGTLSLVISQTQEVHDQIADLLLQLRKLQDLQVTIEVRFITLSDNFFERIGVDFDFDIDDNTGLNLAGLVSRNEDGGPSISLGLDPMGNPTADLDLSFTQDGFGAAVPAFGGFDAATAANFGFAILSDIEAFFLIQAAQGDSRTNVLQAPKVTLFNGQQASIQDQAQQPFVTSIIPVVGDFSAAQQPVITVLSEGTTLSVQAVVSPDRRFVRLTLVPFFSQIGRVRTFTFQGRTSSNTGTSSADPSDDTQTVQNGAETITEGTTVQLPEFIFTSVTTTVSVPDGGTVLLGGIKRVKEGRTERGVPFLNKLPYVNRLFKNVGIGRETESLMLMVTPRIIIQDEEEELLLGTSNP